MAKNNKRLLTTKSSLVIRLVAGMYLMYLAYQLFIGLNTSDGAPIAVVIGAAVIFAVCGVILVVFSGRAFLKGEYQGGIMDVSETEDLPKESNG